MIVPHPALLLDPVLVASADQENGRASMSSKQQPRAKAAKGVDACDNLLSTYYLQ